MQTITIHRLADLRTGDRILNHGGRAYRTPLRVTSPWGPLNSARPFKACGSKTPIRPAASSGSCTPRRWMDVRWKSSAPSPC